MKGKGGATVRENPKRETILAALAAGETVSGEEISQALGVTRAAVWKQITSLRADGYAIPGDPHSGYRLLADGARAYEVSLLRAFAGAGRRVIFRRETGSTNTDLKALAAAGAPTGTLLVAETQTDGRGRRGRSFFSPEGGVYFSLLLRPTLPLVEVSALTGAVAVAVARVLEEQTGIPVGIKWVNDLWLGGKKAVGILCEAAADLETGTADYVVVGVGINLTGTLPSELDGIATTVERAGGRVPDRATLIAGIVREIEAVAPSPLSPGILSASRRRSVLLGRDVTVLLGGEARSARASAINDRGELVVEYPDGKTEALSSGEVSVRLPEGVR